MQIDRADRLIAQLELMNRPQSAEEDLGQTTTSASEGSGVMRQGELSPSYYGEGDSILSDTTEEDLSNGALGDWGCLGFQHSGSADPPPPGSEFHAMIDYLHRVRREQGSACIPQPQTSQGYSSSGSSGTAEECAEVSPFEGREWRILPTRIVIEELDRSGPSLPLNYDLDNYMPLAQESGDDSSLSERGDGHSQQDSMEDYREWMANLRGFTPPSRESSTTNSHVYNRSSTSIDSTPRIIELTEGDHSSNDDSSDFYERRNLPLAVQAGLRLRVRGRELK